MTKAKARLALAVVLVAGAVVGAAPSSASAFEGYYNCILKPSNQWCDGKANGSYDGLHSWDYNEGWYPGVWDGTVTACQHLWKPSTGGQLSGESCGFNFTSHYYGSVQCVCYEAEVKQLSGGSHSINGFADADF